MNQRIVEKNFEVIVEKPVVKEIIVEKPYEVIIEKPVENRIEKEIIIEKFIDNPIERVIEKFLAQRKTGELFADTYRRIAPAPSKEALYETD